ncbi:MAG: DUF3341 domain-containing protein [Planctomycetota bacterium]
MADHVAEITAEPKTLGVLAEFPGPDELVEAAAKTTDAGYKRVEAFSPFPIHGIDAALKAKKTILPWIVFACGLKGCIVAQLMQHYMNAAEGPWMFAGYAYRISGKPYISLPSSIPVTFELIVLLSAFGAFFGMWALNGLPRLSNPLFRDERFKTATSHGFFLWIDAKDGKFSEGGSTEYLTGIGATSCEPVHEEVTGRDVPGLLLSVGVVGAAIALVPPMWVAAASGQSSLPRISIWWCMDYQPKFKAQTTSTIFADGRAMRAALPGTIARGDSLESPEYNRGYSDPAPSVAGAGPRKTPINFVSLLQQDDTADADNNAADEDGGGAAAADPAAADEKAWVTEFPEELEITAELMDRGELQFNIYCGACHGLGGDGDGLITKRAMALQQGTWVTPTSIHSPDVRQQPVGKLYETISIGRRRMPGYAQQIAVKDRWAIVLYMRALQRSRQASIEDVPAEQRVNLP